MSRDTLTLGPIGTAAGVCLAVCFLTVSSPADDAPKTHDDVQTPAAAVPEPPLVRRWYGWQTLVTDGVAVGLFAFAKAAGDNSAAVVVGGLGALGAYVLGAPLVHVGHRRYGVAFGDLGIRIAAPVLFALVALLSHAPRWPQLAGRVPLKQDK